MSFNRLHILSIAVATLFLVASQSVAQASKDEQQIEVSLRMIGHQVLLSSGDSTSRVLPIKKEEGRYRIQFDTEFQFDSEVLAETIDRVVKESGLEHSYIVEMEECTTGDIIYSYQVDSTLDSSNACAGREQPYTCYNLLFTILDQKAEIKPSDSEKAEANQTNYLLIAAIVLLVLFIGLLLMLRAKRGKSKINPNLIALGKYRFDKQNAALILEEQRIELTGKEADLLLLLHQTVNATVEREVILNKVWGDEGDYIGRTLDVFISKLRKKLEADASVKIVNIRGVGYKLVINK
jgi:hypothetical protein